MENTEEKIFELEIKALTDEGTGTFSGMLSPFGNIDDGGDIVEEGAFAKTLKENNAFPLTWAHIGSDPSLIVGAFQGEEKKKGLKIDGEFFGDPDSQKVRQKVKALYDKGIKIGLSIGYKTIKYLNDVIDSRPVRRLKELKLKEGGLTLFPMNALARIEDVKAEWTTAFINSLPDAAFAVIEPAYSSGDTQNKNARHLPHHNKGVTSATDDASVDLPHLRNALARANQITPVTDSISEASLRAKAMAHLSGHAKRMSIGKEDELEEKSGRVISTANLKLLEKAIEAMNALLKAAELPEKEPQGKEGLLSPVVEELEKKQAARKHLFSNTLGILEKS